SQTAENLFWVGRYAERILGNARFQRTVMQFLTQGNQLLANDHIQAEQNLLMALTHHTCTYPGFVGERNADKLAYPSTELAAILFDTNRPGSLSFNINLFTRAVHAVRDHWSTDTWRVLKTMEDEWQNVADNTPNSFKMITMLNHLITSMVAFIGLNRESISREQGWIILDAGRKIEQSLLLISMLRATLVNKQEELVEYNLQEAVLKSNETLVNYRYKYRVHLQLPLVLDLMLFDENNPRSLMYQITRLKYYLTHLPKKQKEHSLSEHERLILEAYTLLKIANKDDLSALDKHHIGYENLDNFLSKMYA
ncbi:MAG: alpha-E domain-containing protein, partial [Chitinophagaceae bacterium]